MGAEAQVALEKFARYFDVECRLVPVDEEVCTHALLLYLAIIRRASWSSV